MCADLPSRLYHIIIKVWTWPYFQRIGIRSGWIKTMLISLRFTWKWPVNLWHCYMETFLFIFYYFLIFFGNNLLVFSLPLDLEWNHERYEYYITVLCFSKFINKKVLNSLYDNNMARTDFKLFVCGRIAWWSRWRRVVFTSYSCPPRPWLEAVASSAPSSR